MPEDFDVSWRDATVLVVTGEVDSSTVAVFSDELLAASGRTVGLDLSGCGFMDSSGVSVLVEAHEAAHVGGGSVMVLAASEPVTRLLQICGLSEVFGVGDGS